MQQHPVPQNISSYQFRLIGDMTLKQFLELAAGIGVGFIFYSTNLIFPIKWFFVLISVILGVAFAFMPLEGMPLDRWLIAFIKAAYSPNQFVWKKSSSIPEYLKSSPASTKPAQAASSPISTSVTSPPNDQDAQRIDHLINLFDKQPITVPSPDATPSAQSPQIRPQYQVTQVKNQPSPKPTQQTRQNQANKLHSKTLKVIPLENVRIAKQPKAIAPTSPQQTVDSQPTPGQKITPANQARSKPTVQGTTNSNLPFPSLPEKPNVLVGMVLDHQGKIVENAIIEISDHAGVPVRATKTNKLGQFFSVTPLKDGTYKLTTEKPGLSFDTISVNLSGDIYSPLEIRAKGVAN